MYDNMLYHIGDNAVTIPPEYEKIIADSFARSEAIEAERRKREGGVLLCLERAADDPQPNDTQFQQELGVFSASLHDAGLKFSQRAIAFDAVDGGGYPLPEFVIALQNVLQPAIIAPISALCGAWLQARYGRKVRLKIGDIEAEGRSEKEVAALLQRAAAFQDERRAKAEDALTISSRSSPPRPCPHRRRR